jgi:hypothetical protein
MVMNVVDLNEITGEFRAIIAEEIAVAGGERENGYQLTPKDAFEARPRGVKPDYAELSREHMARYPRIRAALAE